MRKWIPLVIVALAFIASGSVYPDLPERVPSHWNLSGEIDGWTSKRWGVFVMPLLLVGGLAMFHFLPRIDPRGANYSKFKGTYEILIITSMIFILGVHLAMLATALGKDVSMERLMPIGVGVLFMVIGNLLPRTRPNWFMGVRTPWTLSSDRVWDRTHRLSGHLFVGAGLLILLAALFAPRQATIVMSSSAVVIAVFAFAYSYVIWKQEPEPRKPPGGSVRER